MHGFKRVPCLHCGKAEPEQYIRLIERDFVLCVLCKKIMTRVDLLGGEISPKKVKKPFKFKDSGR